MTCRLRWCVEMESRCRIAIWWTFGRIQWHMSSQSHISHCMVLPPGEFTVTIPEPHATLQGAVTWRNQCRDRDTLQGVRIPSAILKIVFRHILFYFFKCSLGFDERRLSYRLRYTCLSHSRTVVRECCKGDDASQWRSPKFDPRPRHIPYAGIIKIGRGDYVVNPYTCVKVCHDSPRGFLFAHAWLCAPNCTPKRC